MNVRTLTTTDSKPLVVRAKATPQRAARRPMSHLAFSCIVGSIGMGLWVIGYQFFDSSMPGFIGLVIIGIAALLSTFGGGLGVAKQEQQQPAPPPSIVQAWSLMTYSEKLRTWPQLNDAQKDVLVADARARQKVAR
jgi:hypothetical protein